MTAQEEALRDAWVAELWPVCREYKHDTSTPSDPVEVVETPPTRRQADRLECPFCGKSFQRVNLPSHLSRVHSASYEEVT